MAAIAAKKVKSMAGCSTEADYSLFCLFSNKKRPIKRLPSYGNGRKRKKGPKFWERSSR
jgi:hypothetical protein